MDQTRSRLLEMPRERLLYFLAAAISEMTLYGRSSYASDDAVDSLYQTNETIHRIAGHLRDLTDLDENFTASRADGVLEQISLLPAEAIQRLFNRTPLA